MTEESADNIDEEELKPLEVIVKNQLKEKENTTSIDTKDEYDFELTEEQIKEMTDAQ